MRARPTVGVTWLGVTTLLVLGARAVAYSLAAPAELTERLQGSAGGPGLVVVTLVSLGVAAAISTAVVWLAALGVRERQRLRPERSAPTIRLRRLARRGSTLFVCGSLLFALLESYLHWRAGIGFHGFACLRGPVHRDAVPVLAGLALVAASLAEAVQHLLAWLRATVRELLRERIAGLPPLQLASARPAFFRVEPLPRALRARAPPLRA